MSTVEKTVSPALYPYTVAGVQLRNRIMMSPMCQHRANGDGRATDWHLVHYGSRAVGNVGLIMLEDTAITPEGRLGSGALGLYEDDQVAPLARVVEFCHTAGARLGIQIGHAGRKAFLVDGPTAAASAKTVAPTALPFNEQAPTPRALRLDELPAIVDAFVKAAGRGLDAGVDLIELHAGHGYLLHEFLSPVTNLREDEYGGSLEARARLLLEVVSAVRSSFPDAALSVRLSAVDLAPRGMEIGDAVVVAGWLRDAGVDIIDVSSGGLIASPVGSHSSEQPALAARIRRDAEVATIGVGGVESISDADRLIDDASCDVVGVGRALLRNPFWVREAEGSSVPVHPALGEQFRGL